MWFAILICVSLQYHFTEQGHRGFWYSKKHDIKMLINTDMTSDDDKTEDFDFHPTQA